MHNVFGLIGLELVAMADNGIFKKISETMRPTAYISWYVILLSVPLT